MKNFKKIISLFLLIILFFSYIPPLEILANDNLIKITRRPESTIIYTDSNQKTAKFYIDIENNRICQQPADIVLVFDKSGSMKDDGNNPPQPITSAKNAAINFVNQINLSRDQLALVQYDDNAQLKYQLGKNASEIKTLINTFVASGSTNIADALKKSTTELTSSRINPQANKVIVLFSDGKPNKPTEQDGPPLAIAAADEAKSKGIKVISIGLGNKASGATMRALASPNSYYFAPNVDSLNTIYNSIAKDINGISSGTIITEDLTELLKSFNLVSYSPGGVFANNKLTWNLGDLECGAKRTLEYTLVAKDGQTTSTNYTAVTTLTNSTGEKITSNTSDIKLLSPVLTLNVSGDKTFAIPGDRINYEIKVTNIGEADAINVDLKSLIPEHVDLIKGTITLNRKLINPNTINWIFNISKDDEIIFNYSGLVSDSVPEGYSDLNMTGTLNNDGYILEGNFITKVFKEPVKFADYEIFPVCVDIKEDNTYTAIFGYENKIKENQNLKVSSIFPATLNIEVPTSLKPGRYEKAFEVNAPRGVSITWNTIVNFETKNASINDSFISCSPNTNPTPTPTPIITTPSTIEEFGGTPISITKPSSNKQNASPSIEIVLNQKVNICSERRVNNIKGFANDKDGVIAALQYSLDNGNTWLPVENLRGLGTAMTEFEIISPKLTNHKYVVLVRALDNNQNIGLSNRIDINLACDGIIIGTNHFATNSIESIINEKGNVIALNNDIIDFTVEIIGGAEKAELQVDKEIYKLEYNFKLNLWQTQFIAKEGDYKLKVKAFNQNDSTEKEINTLKVLTKSKIENSNKTKVSIYSKNKILNTWELWDGNTYGVQNPKWTEDGEFGYILPKGEYFIQFEAENYSTITSSVFIVEEISFINSNIILEKYQPILSEIKNIFSPTSLEVTKISSLEQTTEEFINNLIEKPAQEIAIENIKQTITQNDITAEYKPTLITLMNTWSTNSDEQNNYISSFKIKTSDKYSVLQVADNELLEKIKSQNIRGGYIVDPLRIASPKYLETWKVITTPQHYFIDNKGIVREIVIGKVLTDSEIDSIFNKINKEFSSSEN